jgi:DNA-directed RNA polymerase III subunit RPC7
MPTYSQRYTKKKNTLPKLSSRPFVKSFFPEELWAIVEPGSVVGQGVQKKTLNLSTRTKLDRFDTELDDAEEDGDGDEGGDEDKVEGEDEDKEEEDPDQFDEDDEDDNDDYNAEQYFDGGDDDEFGGDDGGGDGDDY